MLRKLVLNPIEEKLVRTYKKIRPDTLEGRVLELDVSFYDKSSLFTMGMGTTTETYTRLANISGKMLTPDGRDFTFNGRIPLQEVTYSIYASLEEQKELRNNARRRGEAVWEKHLSFNKGDVIRIRGWERDSEFLILKDPDVLKRLR